MAGFGTAANTTSTSAITTVVRLICLPPCGAGWLLRRVNPLCVKDLYALLPSVEGFKKEQDSSQEKGRRGTASFKN
jgi:hypothetical protein